MFSYFAGYVVYCLLFGALLSFVILVGCLRVCLLFVCLVGCWLFGLGFILFCGGVVPMCDCGFDCDLICFVLFRLFCLVLCLCFVWGLV